VATATCSSSRAPLTPTPAGAKLTAPAPESPADSAALTVLRPTLIVRNGSSDQSAARFYEFHVSDRSDFSGTSSSSSIAFSVLARKSGIPEGPGGTTSYTVDFDLQPTTRFYWRARMVQGAIASDWSATRSFTTPIMGYSR